MTATEKLAFGLFLAGDFGGTSARLALFELVPGALPRLAQHASYPAREVDGVQAAVERFLAELTRADAPTSAQGHEGEQRVLMRAYADEPDWSGSG